MNRRENTRQRRPPFLEPRTRLLLVCGGKVTEPEYFAGLKRLYRNPAVHVQVKKKAVDPRSLVEYACTIRGLSPDTFDEVWCVTDVDQFDLTPAIELALSNEIRLAISNPCFEVWLLLHFDACTGAVRGPTEAVRLLKRHLPAYSKSELRLSSSALELRMPSHGREISAPAARSRIATRPAVCGP